MKEQKIRHGQALAMQWVAFLLQKINLDIKSNSGVTRLLLGNTKTEGGKEGLNVLALGCDYVMNFILPLAIELSLKALILKEGGTPGKSHDLLVLYKKLLPQTQNKLENEYRLLKNIDKNNFNYLKHLLKNHRNDFIEYRYLENAEKLYKEEVEMQKVICVVLGVYNMGSKCIIVVK